MSTTEPRLWDRLEKLLESDWTYPPYLDNLLDTILPIIEADREQALLEQATYFEKKITDQAIEARIAKLLQAKRELAEARELLRDAISGYVDVDPRLKWVDVQLHKADLERIQDYLTRTEPKEAPTFNSDMELITHLEEDQTKE